MENLEGEEIKEEYKPTQCNPEGFFSDTNDQAASVKVALRVRPLIGRELREASHRICIETDDINDKLKIGNKEFTFDRVFGTTSEQGNVFEICSRNLVLGTFEGYNATILAYGQTGSGKTHTMGTGTTVGLPEAQIGIVPRVFGFIFDELENRKKQNAFNEYTVKVQFLELYGEEMHDLLAPGTFDKTGASTKNLMIREEKGGAISVQGLKGEIVQSREECLQLLNKGISHRVTSATNMNEGSSRSHAIFTVTIDQKIVKVIEQPEGADPNAEPVTQDENISAKFHFVDLAGSERIKKTGATGQTLKEGIQINMGLTALGNVISALTDPKKSNAHIPYRDSKLTRILQDSLGGNSRTTMIACASPAESNYDESLSTIKYASRARNIKNKPIVNRDANSMLIEALRIKIAQLEAENEEYQKLLKSNGVAIPDDLKMKAESESAAKAPMQRQATVAEGSGGGGGASAAEVRELKIKLSRAQREMQSVKAQLNEEKEKIQKKEQSLKDLQEEKDGMSLKMEAQNDLLSKNNIKHDLNAETKASAKTMSLVDDYKRKLAKIQAEMEQKTQELLTKSKKIAELQTNIKRDEQMLKRKIDENTDMKREIKKLQEAASRPQSQPQMSSLAAARAAKKAAADNQGKTNPDVKLVENFQEDFMDRLTTQLDNLFVSDPAQDETASQTTQSSQISGEEQQVDKQLNEDAKAQSLEDKEKILNAVKNEAKKFQSDLQSLLKNTQEQRLQELQSQVMKAKTDMLNNKQKTTDQSKIQAIEKEYNKKMEDLTQQMNVQQREKQKKYDAVMKQMQTQEARLKSLEIEIQKLKKKRDELEQEKKYGEERFSKFKQTVVTEKKTTKKTVQDKEGQVNQLKAQLKKTEDMAKQKISELKGLQKRAKEDAIRRQQQEEAENEKKGIDIDAIKEWIQMTTQQMLNNQELNDYMNKQIKQKTEIEDEMLDEGDRLTDLMINKERLEFEMEEMQNSDDIDEGRVLEIEDELEAICQDIDSINETLDTLDEHLGFVADKINELKEQIAGFDPENIKAPRFKGLDSVEAARTTLKTFFLVMLDLNVYKRDLEQKCIEQDEQLLDLQSQVTMMQNKIGLSDAEKAHHLRKQQAIKSIVSQMEGVEYMDNREAESLQLSTAEQQNLTKLSLSKIVNNLRSKLKDEERKNQNLSLKLDQALSEKDAIKQKFAAFKKEQSNKSPYGMTNTRSSGHMNKSSTNVQAKVQTSRSSEPIQSSSEFKGYQVKNSSQQQEPDGSQSPAKKRMSFKERRDLKKTETEKRSTAATNQTQKNFNSLNKAVKKPIVSQYAQQNVPSLKDRRNQVKNTGDAQEQKQKLEKDLEQLSASAQQMKQTESGRDRYLSRAQHYTAKLPKVEENADEEQEAEDEEAMLMAQLAEAEKKFVEVQSNTNNIDDSMINFEEDDNEEVTNTKKFSWNLENVVDFPSEDKKLVDYDSVDERLMLMFEDLTLRECNLETKQVVKELNIGDLDGAEEIKGSKAVAFSMFKDLNTIAVATENYVHLFDYEADLTLVTKLKVANVKQVTFCEVYVILVIETEDLDGKIDCYALDEEHPVGTLTVKSFQGQKILVKPGEQSIHYATGNIIGRISVPDMELMFQEETETTKEILDFAISDTCIFTTGDDTHLRIFDVENGYDLIAPMENLECDVMAVQGIHLVTRCGGGEAMLVWKFTDDGEELEEVDYIEIDDNEQHKDSSVTLKGGLKMVTGGQEYNLIIFVRTDGKSLNVKMLKNKTHVSIE